MLAAVVAVAAAWSALVHAGPCWNLTHPECWFSGRALLHGGPSQLGDFHGCVDRLRQQYCLLSLRLAPAVDSREQPSQLWLSIQEAAAARTRFRRDLLERGLCVPAGAAAQQVAEGVQSALSEAASAEGVTASVEAAEGACQTAGVGAFQWDTADVAVGGVAVFLLALMVVATATEGLLRLKNSTAKSKGLRTLLCFSVISNWRRLAQPPRKHLNLRYVQGARFLTMTIIILGHRIVLLEAAPILNPEFIEKSYGRIDWTTIFNGHLVVNTYFVISGFLLSYLFLQEVASRRKFRVSYIWWACLYRYLRLTPSYAATVAVASTLAPHAGRGPLWARLLGWDRRSCRSHWWANMLYVNNYVHADDTCLLHTWYLATDTQLFAVFLVVLAAVWRWPRAAPHLLAACAALSCLVPALAAYFLQLDPTLLSLPETLRRLSYDETFLQSYVPAHMSASPYVAGVIAGYVLHRRETQAPGKRLPKWAVALCWVVPLTLPMATLVSPYPFYQDDWLDSPTIAAVYQAFFRLTYGVGIALVFFASASGVGWFASSALSWRPFQPLGRLTYSAYLVHYTMQKCKFGLQFHEEYVAESRVISHWFSDIMEAYFCALVLCLMVELPTSALCNVLLPQGARREGQEAPSWKGDAINGVKVSKNAVVGSGISLAPSVDLNMSATTASASTNGSVTTLSMDGRAPAGKLSTVVNGSHRSPPATMNGLAATQSVDSTSGSPADVSELVTTPTSEIYGAAVWRLTAPDVPATTIETCHL
ncbi:nose resistant to fluoxetine protein 6-like [Schistocerca gregaria]|uniref:nose resistant to fluoxetine protein 6-like n=1 Tax=Schistocerca gregaria TaxID=7010 RepID=UPI00211E24B1|nr:nose resistant to fluoxetine protein 6-like [Schistocerca gregaria]